APDGRAGPVDLLVHERAVERVEGGVGPAAPPGGRRGGQSVRGLRRPGPALAGRMPRGLALRRPCDSAAAGAPRSSVSALPRGKARCARLEAETARGGGTPSGPP